MRGSASRGWAVAWSTLLIVSIAGAAAGMTAAPAASVPWTPSAGFLVSEVVTGGATASDEFVELYNAAAVVLDLAGLELVYVTASGSTVTRKASWPAAAPVGPGRHVLIANVSGAYAATADATYSGGFAATGGSLALRAIGGEVVDALSWGDATSTFVEGTAGSAPAAGSSLERLPGGAEGNARDTNDNAADTRVVATPIAQNLSAAPTPGTVPTPTSAPSASATAAPTATATATASPSATGSPAPTATEPPTPAPTASATPSPTATPSPVPSATPTPTATPIASISAARGGAEGTPFVVEGVLTTPLGLVESGHGAFVQDATGGIALYLGTADWPALPTGTLVRVAGTASERFAQATLRLATATDVTELGPAALLPEPLPISTGAAAEAFEGLLVTVEGSIVGSPDAIADGFAVDVDDGSGSLRVVVASASGIPSESLANGAAVRLTGPLGQRDSSGTGTAGYRLHLRSPSDVVPVASPTPSPTPTAPPSDGPTPSPGTTPSPTPTASASPSPTAMPVVSIAAARRLPLDARVAVRGTVTAEPGRLVDERTFFIADGSGGIAVHLEGERRGLLLERGRSLTVTGRIGQRYGNLEVRLAESDTITLAGLEPLPQPVELPLTALAEGTEGVLARVRGTVASVDVNGSGSASIVLRDGDAQGRVFLFPAFEFAAGDVERGDRVVATGVVGQRASGTGRADGYRLWPRDAADLVVAPGTAASPPPGSNDIGPASGVPPRVSIADALRSGGEVTVTGVVTTPPGLLDADGRRAALQDASAAILVRFPAGFRPSFGARLSATGEVGTYFGAPQLAAAEVVASGSGDVAVAAHGAGALGLGLEWRVVRVTGIVVDVRRSGQDWRADVRLADGTEILVNVTERAGIPSTAIGEGDGATITGIVRRPYPTASDRRFALVPRFPTDVRSTGSAAADASAGDGGTAGPTGAAGAAGPGSADALRVAVAAVDVTLDRLPRFDGRLVRVGGEVVERGASALAIEDGSGSTIARFPVEAAPLVSLVEPGDIVNAIGVVARVDGGWEVVARGPEDLARVGAVDPDDAGAMAGVDSGTAGPAMPSALARRTASTFPDLGSPAVAALGILAVTAAAAALAVAAVVARRRRVAALAARFHTLGLDVPPGASQRPAKPSPTTVA